MDNQYDYGFRLGLADGRVAAMRGERNHGGLLGANDAYADGYRQGLNDKLYQPSENAWNENGHK